MSTPIPEEKVSALRELLFKGRKIEAIRVYREISGLGLKESKEAVEELEKLLRAQSPEKFSSPPRGKGCLGAAAAICVCVVVTVAWIFHR